MHLTREAHEPWTPSDGGRVVLSGSNPLAQMEGHHVRDLRPVVAAVENDVEIRHHRIATFSTNQQQKGTVEQEKVPDCSGQTPGLDKDALMRTLPLASDHTSSDTHENATNVDALWKRVKKENVKCGMMTLGRTISALSRRTNSQLTALPTAQLSVILGSKFASGTHFCLLRTFAILVCFFPRARVAYEEGKEEPRLGKRKNVPK